MTAPEEAPPAGTGGAEENHVESGELSAVASGVHDPLANIPLELRQLPRWVAATHDKLPFNPRTGEVASVNDPSTWATFDEARACGSAHVGFVLTAFDDYVAIDIDDKAENPACDEERAVQIKVLDSFQSYTERSVGARWTDAHGNKRGGYHIIIRGKMQGGRDRGHIGVYSSARYILFTGDVVRPAPILDEQELLDKLLAQMPVNEVSDLVQVDGDMRDDDLHEMAKNAANGEKYAQLCRGEWKEMGCYPSPSEADLALISILAFYTRDNEQVRRMFRYTALGKREKHQGSNRWIDRCLRIVRAKQPSEAQIEAGRALAASIEAENEAAEDEDDDTFEYGGYDLPTPPGLVGELADYFYANAYLPMAEGAIMASLGWMSAILGRVFNLNKLGLTLHMMLLAESGRGKEGMADGIGVINDAISRFRHGDAGIYNFMGPGRFASGPGLVRALESQPSMLCIQPEFGLRLKELNNERNQQASELRNCLLQLHSKSGWNKTFASTAYADVDKNTKLIPSPNLVLLGESTPINVFNNIDFDDVEDGLLARMLVLECESDIPDANEDSWSPPDEDLVRRLVELFDHAEKLGARTIGRIQPWAIVPRPEAKELLSDFRRKVKEKLNDKSTDPYARILWNRAPDNMMRVAGLIAAGAKENWSENYAWLEREHVEWAIRFVEHCVSRLLRRFQAGDVGKGDERRLAQMKKHIKAYRKMTPKARLSARYCRSKKVSERNDVVSEEYLSKRAASNAAFTKAERGMNSAISSTIDALCRRGFMKKMGDQELKELGLWGNYYQLTPGVRWD